MAEESSEIVRPKQRPRLLTLDAEAGERHASWLELFFDLVFVLAVAQVAQVLAKNSDLDGILKFAVVFVPVWWTWVNFTFYADRFESNEVVYRTLTFAGMLAVAAWSLTLPEAFSPAGGLGLVVTYCLVRLVLIALYIRSAYYVPLARSLSFQFITGFSSAVVVFLLSLLFEPPVRYYLWGLGLVLELATPFLSLRLTRVIPYDYSHIPERFGLFTIIVLGEAVIATATGASLVSWTPAPIVMASIGFAMAACIWWMNFEFVEDDALMAPSLGPRFVYVYSHYFIVASIVALGIGVEHAIKETKEAHLHLPTLALLGGGIATYFTATTIVKLAAGVCTFLPARLLAIALSLSMIFLGQFMPPLTVAGGLVLILVAGVWLESRLAEGREQKEVTSQLTPCEHSISATVTKPRSSNGCEECVKNNYKWVHLRLCLECGHVGCCDSSRHKHATRHFHKTDHAIVASLEEAETWAWCYVDDRFVPPPKDLDTAAVKI